MMNHSEITNPAPKPLAICTVTTDSGSVTLPCEPINEWLAITPVFGMDDDGNSALDGGFTITHRPTGGNIVEGPGCIECCRSAGKVLDGLGIDWAGLTKETSNAWAAALPDDVKRKFAEARAVAWSCDSYTCEPWSDATTEAGSQTVGAVA
jgi:hypothetical protein